MFCRACTPFSARNRLTDFPGQFRLSGVKKQTSNPVGGIRGINGLRITIDGIQKLFPEVYRRKFAEDEFADSEKTAIFENTFPKLHTPTKFVLHFAERASLRNGARSFDIPMCGHTKNSDSVSQRCRCHSFLLSHLIYKTNLNFMKKDFRYKIRK